jgi:hypothetical protein
MACLVAASGKLPPTTPRPSASQRPPGDDDEQPDRARKHLRVGGPATIPSPAAAPPNQAVPSLSTAIVRMRKLEGHSTLPTSREEGARVKPQPSPLRRDASNGSGCRLSTVKG